MLLRARRAGLSRPAGGVYGIPVDIRGYFIYTFYVKVYRRNTGMKKPTAMSVRSPAMMLKNSRGLL